MKGRTVFTTDQLNEIRAYFQQLGVTATDEQILKICNGGKGRMTAVFEFEYTYDPTMEGNDDQCDDDNQ